MKNFTYLMGALSVDKNLQLELADVETEPDAYLHFFKMKGYDCTINEIEDSFKDLVWFARIGDDIDHA